jgi:hypothetical protein
MLEFWAQSGHTLTSALQPNDPQAITNTIQPAADYQSAAAKPEFQGKRIRDVINRLVTLVFRRDGVDEQGQEWQQMSVNVTKRF